MSRHAPPIVLAAEEVTTLDAWARSRTLPARVVERARIVRLAADGVPSQDIAQRLGVSRPTVQLWRERFLYRQRAKAVSLIGTHPQWARVLVPLDLGLASLLVLRHLEKTIMTHTEFEVDFLHVVQGESRPLKRWRDIHKILGWREPVPLRVVASRGSVPATILHELRNGDFGTLVMGKRGLSRIKQFLLGSVSAAVLQQLTNQTLLLID